MRRQGGPSAERIIRPEEWRDRADTVFWITQEYSRALESAIRKHPEQYLWMHRRWKSRPKDETGGQTRIGRV